MEYSVLREVSDLSVNSQLDEILKMAVLFFFKHYYVSRDECLLDQ